MQDLSTGCALLPLRQAVASLYLPYLSYFTMLTRFVLLGGIQRSAAVRGWHVWQPNGSAE